MRRIKLPRPFKNKREMGEKKSKKLNLRRLNCYILYVVIFGMLAALVCKAEGGDATTPGEFKIDPATLKCLGFRWYIGGDDNGNAEVEVAYRKKGASEWKKALPFLRVNREVVGDKKDYTCDNLLAGSILGLSPDTEYEVHLSLFDPDGGKAEKEVVVKTRALPIAPKPLRTLHLYPRGFNGMKKGRAFVSLKDAVAVLKPGDLLLIHPGVHQGGVSFIVKGTARTPIVIRGAGGGESIIAVENKNNLNIGKSEHLFLEDLTLKGGNAAVRAFDSKNLVVRRCKMLDVVTGVQNQSHLSENWYIADNVIIGCSTEWFPRKKCKAFTGIEVYGRGHVVCYNRIEKFWDCLTISNFQEPMDGRDLKCVAIDMYGNDLSQAVDDCIETDYGCHNIRVWGNRLRAAHCGISCQPVYGGPVYLIRNELYGFNNTAYKLYCSPSGIYMLHNTSVAIRYGLYSPPIWQNGILRNNLFIGRRGSAINTGSPHKNTTLDYNGYDNTRNPSYIIWTDWTEAKKQYASLTEFAEELGHEKHGIMVDYNIFKKCPKPMVKEICNPGHYDLQLMEGSKPVDAGVYLPNINGDFRGKAPDIGCYEFGAPIPVYGPRPKHN